MIAPWLEEAWRTWRARLDAGRMPHAILLAGAAGLGKRAFVEELLAALLCTARDDQGRACGNCRGCRLRESGAHPDFVRVGIEEDATQIKIDQIRAVSERLAMTTQFGGYQVAVIDPAEGMTVECANALLKTLEEPARNTVIILVSDAPARLPATIRSRCQRIDVRFPPRTQALAWLAEQGLSGESAQTALGLVSGNPGAALELAQPAARQLLADTVNTLVAIAGGRASPVETANRWAREDAEKRLRLIAQAVLRVLRPEGGEPLPEPLKPLANLTATVDFPKLSAWWERANLVREQVRTPLRSDLLILELLRDFRGLIPTVRRA